MKIFSFPRSGNTFTRFIIEYISGRPTKGCVGNGADVPIYKKSFKNKNLLSHVSGTPIATKTHNPKDINNDTVIFILRDPLECVSRHCTYNFKEKHMKKYLDCITAFHNLQKKKICIYYDDLIENTSQVAKQLYDFLQLKDDTFLKLFQENTQEIITDSLKCSEKSSAYQNISGTNLHYHKSFLTEQHKEMAEKYFKQHKKEWPYLKKFF